MRQVARVLSFGILLSISGMAVPKPHIVALGKVITISWRGQNSTGDPIELKVRPLLIDGRTREFVTGMIHEVTERTFIVQRIYRVNDSLPQETGPQKWSWQRGGWLLVDRGNGRVQFILMPNFDPDSSAVNWYRDYAAYCGDSDDSSKTVAVIVQLGQRKPLLKKIIGEVRDSEELCPPPRWERNPIRATFELKSGQKLTFAVKNRAAEVVSEDEDQSGE